MHEATDAVACWRGGLLALSGCGADGHEMTPSPTPEPTLSDSELVEAGSEAYQAFLDELYAMYAEFDYDYTRLTPYVSQELATSAVSDMQRTHEEGLNIDGSPVVAHAQLITRGGHEAQMAVCIDGRGGRVYDVESGAVWAATASQINGWDLAVVLGGDGVTIDQREPLEENPAVCASVI